MNGNCFEIGTIQAFLDGELSPDKSLRLTDHIVDCDACARLVAEAEEENSVVFSALERELNMLVPTQRLWTRINESIEVEKSQASFWDKTLAFVRTYLANPSIAAAAGIILVVGLLAMLWMPKTDDRVADNTPRPEVPKVTDTVTQTPPTIVSQPEQAKAPTAVQVKESKLSPDEIRRKVVPLVDRGTPVAPTPLNANYLPGEEGYVKTIADLKQSVDSQKDDVMTPSNRVSYERDMAVVNDSIKRMRDVVKKNPRNQSARQVLYASYQDKIDLLNSVAQREELMASMR